MSDGDGWTSHDDFRELSRPLADAVTALVDAAEQVRGPLAIPEHDSAAMAETAGQSAFPLPGKSDEGVIDVCTRSVLLAFTAAEGHMRAYAALLMDPDHSFIWSMPAVARSAVEALAVARHLTEDGIGLRLRAARTMNLMIVNVAEVNRALQWMDQTPSPGNHRAQDAEEMGLKKVRAGKRSPPAFEEPWPGNSEMVRNLLGSDLGGLIYSYWSAVSHATPWGLLQSLGERTTDAIGNSTGFLTLTMETVRTTCGILGLAHLTAFDEYLSWSGWDGSTYGHAIDALHDLCDVEGDPADRMSQTRMSIASSLLWTPRDT